MRIVIVSAVWCPSCLIMRSRYMELQNKFPNIEFKFYDIDLDEESISYNIGDTLPVFILIDKHNKEIKRIVGEQKADDLSKLIEDCSRTEE